MIYSEPAPTTVYVEPAPVYVEPAPVYVEPAPAPEQTVIVAPEPATVVVPAVPEPTPVVAPPIEPVVTAPVVVHTPAPVYNPVCGVNGQQFANADAADLAGVAIRHVGACRGGFTTPIMTPATPTAPPISSGSCVYNAAANWSACPATLSPVCGHNGVTYQNACVASSLGAQIAAHGACGSTTTALCPDGDAPVCGSDGLTYQTACDAALAQVAVRHQGSCGTLSNCPLQ